MALEDRVREKTREVEETRLEIVRRFGCAGEYRDNETGLHVVRMSHYCHRLALAAGISVEQATLLQLAAPMHDIGKVGIPDAILLKPGKLTPEEWVIMRSHAAIGAAIIGDSPSDLLKIARTVAIMHHERWDGKGYPHGLAGEAIPIEGRIASIADVYDALTSVRPYKKAWTSEEAEVYIVGESGKAFDPALVELFVDLLPEYARIRERFTDETPVPKQE
jgi:putative two-component system response regulator